ncbi:MAG: hypothetical protein Q7R87_03525 [Nanoarchaeota archaeon]|nr:hypothetical protein [Nanoarchaeota archaeon]
MQNRLWMIDCDGVTSDFQDAVIKWHNMSYGTTHRREDITQFSLGRLWGCDQKEELRRLDEFYQTEHFDNVLPISGALSGVDSIRLLGEYYKVMTLTARPESLRQKTHHWFGRHFPNRFDKVILSEAYNGDGSTHTSKIEICKRECAYGIVEDSSTNAIACYKAGIKAVVLDQPWNRRDELPDGVLRAREWEEVAELIGNMR